VACAAGARNAPLFERVVEECAKEIVKTGKMGINGVYYMIRPG